MPSTTEAVAYSDGVGLLFVFNLIVGTGALALPKAFQSAGYVLGIVVTLISCLVSYICATFILESMAVANAAKLRAIRRRGVANPHSGNNDEYQINERIEVSEMAQIFLGRAGLAASYITLTVYLFGDLAIYSTTVPKSIMNIICAPVNSTAVAWDSACRPGWPSSLYRMNIYRAAVLAFSLFATPLVLAGITKTKYLQLSTSVCRWLAFTLMIVLASISLIHDGVEGSPPVADFNGFGSLFGTTVYAFMCQHSLPGIITPMRSKKRVAGGLLIVYVAVLMFYVSLSITGVFAFEHVFDVYTLNFLHDDSTAILTKALNLFLALFPVFTLSTNYPIVANTLANNLHVLIDMLAQAVTTTPNDEEGRLLDDENDDVDEYESTQVPQPQTQPRTDPTSRHIWRRGAVLAAVIIIPTLIAMSTDNVLLLASLTGSYPGVGVQFVIPSLLVVYARRYSKRELGISVPPSASSPFSGLVWPAAMFLWAVFTILMVTLNMYHLS